MEFVLRKVHPIQVDQRVIHRNHQAQANHRREMDTNRVHVIKLSANEDWLVKKVCEKCLKPQRKEKRLFIILFFISIWT